MNTYDIIVVGAGPAGAIFAHVAGKSRRILLLDGNMRGKPCGGLIAPDAQKMLARFDLSLPKSILADPQIFSVKTIDLKTAQVRHYQRMYINTNRDLFDGWLRSLRPPEVDYQKALCKRIERKDDGYLVTYQDEQGDRSQAFAKLLVGADGANSFVRRSFFPKLKTRSYVAVQQWFARTEQDKNPFYSCVFDPDTSDCYSWSLCKDESFIFGGAFPPKNCRARFETQKKKLEQFGFQFGAPLKTEACLVLRPTCAKSFCSGGNNIFLVGEAAGYISPSSLEGISSAIKSSLLLFESLSSTDVLRTYHAKTAGMRMHLVLKNLKGLFMYVPLLRKMVMLSGLTSIDLCGK